MIIIMIINSNTNIHIDDTINDYINNHKNDSNNENNNNILPCGPRRASPRTWRTAATLLRIWISEGLTQAESELQGWSSQALRELPGMSESSHLSRDKLSREIGRTGAYGSFPEMSESSHFKGDKLSREMGRTGARGVAARGARRHSRGN